MQKLCSATLAANRARRPWISWGRSRQRLVGRGGRAETEAGYDPCGICGGEQREAFVPSYGVGPADVGLSCEPSMSPALGVPGGHRRAVQSLVRTSWGLHHSNQMQDESLDEVGVGAYRAVELRTVGQGGEGIAQLGVGVAIEVSLAVETAPTGKDSQGNDLAAGEGGFWTGPSFWRLRVAEVVYDNVKCGEEGVHIEHGSVPFPWGSGGKPTLASGHLPLKFSPCNSHQAFKRPETRFHTIASRSPARGLWALAQTSGPYLLRWEQQ